MTAHDTTAGSLTFQNPFWWWMLCVAVIRQIASFMYGFWWPITTNDKSSIRPMYVPIRSFICMGMANKYVHITIWLDIGNITIWSVNARPFPLDMSREYGPTNQSLEYDQETLSCEWMQSICMLRLNKSSRWGGSFGRSHQQPWFAKPSNYYRPYRGIKRKLWYVASTYSIVSIATYTDVKMCTLDLWETINPWYWFYH